MKDTRQAIGMLIGILAVGAFLLQLTFALAPVPNWPVLRVYITVASFGLAFLLTSEE